MRGGTPQGEEGRKALPSTAKRTAIEERVLGGVTRVPERVVESVAKGESAVGDGRVRMVQLLLELPAPEEEEEG